MSHRRRECAWVTHSGELVIYSFRREQEVIRRELSEAL